MSAFGKGRSFDLGYYKLSEPFLVSAKFHIIYIWFLANFLCKINIHFTRRGKGISCGNYWDNLHVFWLNINCLQTGSLQDNMFKLYKYLNTFSCSFLNCCRVGGICDEWSKRPRMTVIVKEAQRHEKLRRRSRAGSKNKNADLLLHRRCESRIFVFL